MKLEIVRQIDNRSLGRKEIDFIIEHIGGTTPKRADVSSKIAALLDADPTCVIIYRMKTRYGIGKTEGSARIYPNLERLKSVEFEHLISRQLGKAKESDASATEGGA